MPLPRYAIYYTPPPSSPLAEFGAQALGYDCFNAVEVPHLLLRGFAPAMLSLVSVEPRRYGFHATLVAPFEVAGYSEERILRAVDQFAAKNHPVSLGRLEVAAMGRYVALMPAEPNVEVVAFSHRCLEAFNGFRAPLTSFDRERRIASGLTPRQVELLDQWGYPYVLDEFRFHMTLAGPIEQQQCEAVRGALATAFARLAADWVELDAVSLMRQDNRDGRFRVLARRRLTGAPH